MKSLNIQQNTEEIKFSGRTKNSVTKSLKDYLHKNKKLNQHQYDYLLLNREFIKNKKATNLIFQHIYENNNDYLFDNFLTQFISLYRSKDSSYFFSILKKMNIDTISPKIGLILINDDIKDSGEFRKYLKTSLSFFETNYSPSLKDNKEIVDNISKSIHFYFHQNFRMAHVDNDGFFLFNNFIEFYHNTLNTSLNVNLVIPSINKDNLAILENIYLQKTLSHKENLDNVNKKIKKRI